MTLFAQSSLFFGWVEVWRQPIDVYLVDSGSKSLFRFTLRLCIRVKNTELLKKQNKNKKNKTICISNRRDSVAYSLSTLGSVMLKRISWTREMSSSLARSHWSGTIGRIRPLCQLISSNFSSGTLWGRVHKTPGEQNGRQTVVVVQS